ncbi:hypothetical protein AUC31_12030 [Planococcus rifietoensis]|uniref:3-hydroxyisobutyrate dehydrogenase n=1 Tax=Planococcus rifietoensis TaxID=200991 RepID=A0A0U2Z9B3_9BACL|nr:DUF1932 domain-containing protein [Planococcus rifietoensis]ALS75876.1 hypothetical protein AUC31_12030 [Planococcus rifietoensis]
MKIGFIGFGEVGFEMSKGFHHLESGLQLFAFDQQHTDPRMIQRAEEANVSLLDSPLKVAEQNLAILFVAVPAQYAESAWESILPALNNSTLYVDLTTASANIKQGISDRLAATQSLFVDAAIMGPLKGNQHKVPMIVSGTAAEAFISQGKNLEMNLEYVSEAAGDATNIKFIRSIFTKGLSTLLHEVMEVAEKLDLDETITASITDTIDKEPFENVINRLITGNVLHAERRVKEMDNVLEFLNENKVDTLMTKATRDKLQLLTDSKLKERFSGEAPQTWKQVMEKINHSD